MDDEQLIEAAKKVREHAHAPYSNYLVGAAIIDDRGDIHTGCNVENAAYPEGNCAEANAIGAMVAAGGKKIAVIAAVGGSNELEFCTPCGGCRQSILEFSNDSTRVVLIDEDGEIHNYSIDELLPLAFRLRQARL
ncbi:MAG: cytidine deaminase [Woeseia sp.]